MLASPRPAPESHHFVGTATAPQVEDYPQAANSKTGLAVASANRAPRQMPPIQPPLFPDPGLRKVIGLEEYLPAPPPRRSAPARSRPPRRRVIPGQTSFDFDALSAQEVETGGRRCNLPVAPLAVRACAVLLDAGLVVLLLGAFLATVRILLGELPLTPAAAASGGLAVFSTAIVYKLLWGSFGRPTPGLQAVRLRVVTLDGRPARPEDFLKRVFGGVLSFGCAAVGVLWALIDQDRLTWNDYISGTFVTEARPR